MRTLTHLEQRAIIAGIKAVIKQTGVSVQGLDLNAALQEAAVEYVAEAEAEAEWKKWQNVIDHTCNADTPHDSRAVNFRRHYTVDNMVQWAEKAKEPDCCDKPDVQEFNNDGVKNSHVCFNCGRIHHTQQYTSEVRPLVL